MKKYPTLWLILATLLLPESRASVATRSSASYALVAETLDGGGRISQSTVFSLVGSVGGVAAGNAESTPFLAQNGYVPQATANRPPVAQPDSAVTTVNAAATLTVLSNDTDPDGDLLLVLRTTSPAHGSVTINGGGLTVTYTPGTGFAGPDTFSYLASDGLGETVSATVNITVNQAFSSWIQSQFTPAEQSDPGISGPGADPDGDGHSNLLEYALGLDPKSGANSGGEITSGTQNPGGATYLTLSFQRRKNDSGLVYLPEVSRDRETWFSGSAALEEIAITSVNDEFDLVTVRDLTPVTSEQPRFIRLRIRQD